MFSKSLDALYVARALTIGAASATIFGTLWVVQGITAVQAPGEIAPVLFVILALITLGMAAACTRLFTTARLFTPTGDQQVIKQADRYINIATIILVVACVVGPGLLMLWGQTNLMMPIVIAPVGLYMLALAPLLRIVHYYVVGGLLCVIPIGSVLFTPATIIVEVGELQSWTIVNGVVGGLVNLGSGCMNIVLTRRIRRGQHRQNTQTQEAVNQRLTSRQLL